MFLAIVFATLRFIRVSVSTLRGLNRLPGVVLQQLSPSGHPDAGESLGLLPGDLGPSTPLPGSFLADSPCLQ
jgi:hypothetical protein